MEIINIGTFPPPYGGVSVHIARLKEYLDEKKIFNTVIDNSGEITNEKNEKGILVCPLNKKNILRLLFKKKAIIHFHFFDLSVLRTYFILSFRHKTILTFHNERFLDEITTKSWIGYKLNKLFLNKIDAFVVDNKKCSSMANILVKNTSKIKIIQAFIPPRNIPELQEEEIINLRKKHKYIISSNAFKIVFHNEQDLYGIDLLIQLMNNLCNIHKIDVAMVFLLPCIGNEGYFNNLNSRLKTYGIQDNFHFITKPISVASCVWRISDIVIRATNTDINAFTILEALSVGVPVIASDCVERENGTVLFKNRDALDLEEKVLRVLNNIEFYKAKVKEIKIDGSAEKFISLYKSLGLDN